MTRPRIYKDAQLKIEHLLNELKVEHGFTLAEACYSVIKVVGESLVVFEISDRLKKLVEEEYALISTGRNGMKFISKPDNKWHVVVEADGVESHFFAYILEIILAKAHKQKNGRIYAGKEIIKISLEGAIKNAGQKNKCPNRIWYKKGIYYVLIRTNGTKLMFQNQCPKILEKEISEKLPEILQVLSKMIKK